MREKLEAAAKRNNRSLTAEIITRLEHTFSQPTDSPEERFDMLDKIFETKNPAAELLAAIKKLQEASEHLQSITPIEMVTAITEYGDKQKKHEKKASGESAKPRAG